eukprot:TRINITY_DN1827_c1_g2_i1.p1 TRINITY_DN1827_c1_g2~~TRINITY_DN1827_c1_g2_i1.p1  ORF type:complete len:580 (+),score=114.07 TRINITY_DN1827_c1_g2_i1:99-1742(+)
MIAVVLRILPCLLASASAQSAGKRFLGSRDRHHGPVEARGPADLLAELERLDEGALGGTALVSSARVERLEAALLPLFKISPKDSRGYLDANAARYVLHRLFSERHGWFVSGIELHGGVYNSSKVGQALKSGGRFSLRQLARFAATLETLVHTENMERLGEAFDMVGFSRDRSRKDADVELVLEAYMMLFVSLQVKPGMKLERARRFVELGIPSWRDTKVFGREIQQKIMEAERERGESLSLWDLLLRIVEEFGERYGKWQNKDCLDLKAALLEMEMPGTGRVPLSSFWGPSLTEKGWMFTESLPYLKQLGALEGSEAPHHSVVISNYLYSAGNCLASSKYYDVCCLNECESILGEIESAVASPAAEPQHLVEIVAKLASSSVSAPRELPASLVRRLEDIAAHHGGQVPLHGRLFFQFLHHAFPLECPYPYLSLSQAMERDETWITRQTLQSKVMRHEVKAYNRAVSKLPQGTTEVSTDLPWSDEEDLFMQSFDLEAARDSSGLADGHADASMTVPLLGLGLVASAIALQLRQPSKTSRFSASRFTV